jgi:CRP-like cAMP-binding protein
MKELLRQVMSQTVTIAQDEWEAFEPYIFSKSIKKKDLLVREGQICTEIGLVLQGTFRQYHVIDGEEKTTFFFFDHQFVCNYESVLLEAPSNVTIEALEDSHILYFKKEVLYRLYRLYPKYEVFGRLIAENVYLCAMERLNTFLLNSPEERYLKFLSKPDSVTILERVPQHYIASYLGITPVSLSRIRARMAKRQKEKRIAELV